MLAAVAVASPGTMIVEGTYILLRMLHARIIRKRIPAVLA
jgi:hypothetical protein